MDNDKAFAAYALVIFAGVASVLTASVLSGTAALPSALVFLEHLAMSLALRTAYKSLDGTYWINNLGHSEATLEATEAPAQGGIAAGVLS